MKHEPVIMSLDTIINSIDRHSDGRWFGVMGVDIPGLAEVESERDRLNDPETWPDTTDRREIEKHDRELFRQFEKLTERMDAIEADYLKAHGGDLYRVSWPEHVIVPRFNSDASYQPA